MLKPLPCLVILLILGLGAWNAEATGENREGSSSSVTTSSGKLKEILKNKEFQENTEVTDAKLKAAAGSLSTYSLRASLMYTGSSLEQAGAGEAQPDPDHRMPRAMPTTLAGNVGIRYRLSPLSSVGLAGGISADHPFHGVERLQFANPQLGYDHLARIKDVQMLSSVGAALITLPLYREFGLQSALVATNSMIWDIGTKGYALGFDTLFVHSFYDRAYKITDGPASRFILELGPNIKYNFSDKLSARTEAKISLWNPRAIGNAYALLNRMVKGRVGLGYAPVRDIYISPAISFYPEKLAMNAANLDVMTVFSIF